MANKKERLRDKVIKNYSHFVSRYPYLVLFVVIALVMLSGIYSSRIQTKSMSYKNMLPDSVEVIHANNVFVDNFGGTESAKIVIEIDPNYLNSNELRDIRDPEIIRYSEVLEKYLMSSEEILDTDSAAESLRLMHSGNLPNTKQDIISDIGKNPLLSNYISQDGTMLIISLRLRDDFSEDILVYDIEESIKVVKRPAGLIVSPAGDSISNVYVNKQLGNDMSRTSAISMIGIITILILTFGSLKFGLMPLVTIIVGVAWAFGFIGLMGIGMSSATSGVISMIMGIGIDFGIQIITRFRQELKNKKDIEESMRISLDSTVMPMFTTTLAAVIGFKAMSMGQLTIMAEMGTMMTYGVVFCFLASITSVPAIAIISENLSGKLSEKFNKKFEKIVKKKRNHSK